MKVDFPLNKETKLTNHLDQNGPESNEWVLHTTIFFFSENWTNQTKKNVFKIGSIFCFCTLQYRHESNLPYFASVPCTTIK